jgi:hypothetical protein
VTLLVWSILGQQAAELLGGDDGAHKYLVRVLDRPSVEGVFNLIVI